MFWASSCAGGGPHVHVGYPAAEDICRPWSVKLEYRIPRERLSDSDRDGTSQCHRACGTWSRHDIEADWQPSVGRDKPCVESFALALQRGRARVCRLGDWALP